MSNRSIVKLTKAATQQLSQLIQTNQVSNPRLIGIRLSAKLGGCMGQVYDMRAITTEQLDRLDIPVSSSDGVKLYIDNSALLSLIGTTIDYRSNQLKSEFVFHNPNSKDMCGCGESFKLKR